MRKFLIRAGLGFGFLLLGLVAVIAFNTWRYAPEETIAVEQSDFKIDVDQAAIHLSEAVKFQTISTNLDRPDFDGFLQFLEKTFPLVHSSMKRTMVNQKTALYEWSGSDNTQKPILLAAHYDVVPIAPGSEDRWVHPPFSGVIADGFVWGRGTLDNKGALISILSAAEKLTKEGFKPKRTIYLSFSHDEEVAHNGAKSVAKHLNENGVTLDWLLDEGSFVLDKIIPGLDVPVASINLAEKGNVTLELVAKAAGGHSSMPPKLTAVGRLAIAIDRLQKSPVPGGLDGVSEQFFDALGKHFSITQRAIFANRWLFNSLLESRLSDSASTNAILRTTTAPTMLSASNKANVLATEAIATVNFRIHPRDTIESVINHVKAAIADENIEVRILGLLASPASPVSSAVSQGYKDIEASILANFGSLVTVPGLTIARTDASYYAEASIDSYRINPFKIEGDDIRRFHGTNERLSLENIEKGISFFMTLMKKQ